MAGFFNTISNIYKFKPETSIPDLSDKSIIITGGNAGLGYQTVLQLLPHNPKLLIITARSQAKFDKIISNLRNDLKSSSFSIDLDKTIQFVQMDLSSLLSVKSATDTILSMSPTSIDILINNAGIMGAAPSLTPDGYEVHFGTNHMGHALFTRNLLPLLLKSSSTGGARIVNVSSGAYYLSHCTGWDPQLVKTDMATYGGNNGNLLSRYGQSKLANVLHVKGLAKKYPGKITAVAIAPGRCKTDLLSGMYEDERDKFYAWFQWVYDIVIGAHPVNVGAWTQVWAATESGKGRVESGAVYFPVGLRDKESPFVKDEKLIDGLWEWTEKELVAKGF